MAVEPQDLRLLQNQRFRRLLESRLLGQTALNTMLYGLFILVVEETGSSVQSALLVLAFSLPSIVFGIPAGTVADILPKRFTLTAGYAARAAICGALLYYHDELLVLFLLAAAASMVAQFFAPAESAAVPAIVPTERLPAANSLMVLTMVFGQVAGMVVVAPLLFKVFDEVPVFAVAGLLFVGAGFIAGTIPIGRGPPAPAAGAGFIESILRGFAILRGNRRVFLAASYLTITSALMKILVVLLPHYTKDVLNISAENTVFVAAPAAIGAGLGLLLTPPLAKTVGSRRVAAFGFVLFLLGLVALGFVVYIRDAVNANVDIGLGFVEEQVGVSSVITMAMILAIPLGLAYSLATVSSRAVINEEAPGETQGRVFAAQSAVGDLAALPPLFIVGAIADLVGVRATLLASAVAALAIALYLTQTRRFQRVEGVAEQPVQPG